LVEQFLVFCCEPQERRTGGAMKRDSQDKKPKSAHRQSVLEASTLGRTAGKTVQRCAWVGDDLVYIKYHDEEWAVPVHDDKTLFEFLTLESAQAGLSWITILRRREGYRKVFYEFDVHKVAAMTEADIQHALQDERIIRNKLK
jgi:DNA-3-methyladenine glycosylase I